MSRTGERRSRRHHPRRRRAISPATERTLTKSCGSQLPRSRVHPRGPSLRATIRQTKTALMLSMARLPSLDSSPVSSSAMVRCVEAARMARTWRSTRATLPDCSTARSAARTAAAMADSSGELGAAASGWCRGMGCTAQCRPEAVPNKAARRASRSAASASVMRPVSGFLT